jgi:hypothetical protein
MALNFPPSTSTGVGSIYTGTNGITYIYNGIKWTGLPQGGGGVIGGTYTISTLYVNTLTVTSVGAANIVSANDLNLKAAGQITVNAPFVLTTSTIAGLSAIGPITQRGAMVFVTDATGGAQPCYYDGSSWYTVNGRVQVA